MTAMSHLFLSHKISVFKVNMCIINQQNHINATKQGKDF